MIARDFFDDRKLQRYQLDPNAEFEAFGFVSDPDDLHHQFWLEFKGYEDIWMVIPFGCLWIAGENPLTNS